MQLERGREMRLASGRGPPQDPRRSAATPITVMIASGRRALHGGLFSLLAREPDIEIKGEPDLHPTSLAPCVEQHLPRVLLLGKPLLDRLDQQALRSIRAQSGHVRVLLLADGSCQGLVADVLRNRFHGFLLTTCQPELCLKAIRAVSEGELWLSRASLALAIDDPLGLSDPGAGTSTDAPRADAAQTLTPRELQVVALLRKGCINKEIAQELGIKEDTVKKHLQSVFAKLGVHRRALVALRPLPR